MIVPADRTLRAPDGLISAGFGVHSFGVLGFDDLRPLFIRKLREDVFAVMGNPNMDRLCIPLHQFEGLRSLLGVYGIA